MLQQRHIWQAMNDKPEMRAYTQKHLIDAFGLPWSKTAVDIEGKPSQVWTYKTNLKKDYVILNMRPGKTRYLKVTVTDGFVIDYNYE